MLSRLCVRAPRIRIFFINPNRKLFSVPNHLLYSRKRLACKDLYDQIVCLKKLTGTPKTANISALLQALLQARFHTEHEANVRSI